MILIVGLGNPGNKYELSRHNLGFQVLNRFRKKNNFPEFRLSRKFNVLISEDYLDNKKMILAKPQTFMNLSGKAVKILAETYSSEPNNLVVIHDDIDIPLSQIRIVKNRGAGGHKGVESIIKELKTKNFIRFRIGIRPKGRKPKNVEEYVLQKFSKTEKKVIEGTIEKACLAIKIMLRESLEKVMQRYNQ